MKNQILEIKQKSKRQYIRPEITVIKIDNDISLVMMSAGPGNDPTAPKHQQHHDNNNNNNSNNPFK